jgi:pseudouridine-5'-phosphate glycosidase
MALYVHPRIQEALEQRRPVVALESTVISHGLPRPHNLELALELEATVRKAGAEPATVAVIAGKLHVGLSEDDLTRLATEDAAKASLWNLAALMQAGATAGTTVATTLHAAQQAGIAVFATGGIGGVHHETFDESADLHALARYRVVVVCAGAKSILNVAATKERLETLGVPILGYQSDYLAGFHTTLTDLPVPVRVESPAEIAACYRAQQELGLPHALLVSQPVTPGLDAAVLQGWLEQAHQDARKQGLQGHAVTPFLLARLAECSNGQTVRVNRQLLVNNANLAADIATSIANSQRETLNSQAGASQPVSTSSA